MICTVTTNYGEQLVIDCMRSTDIVMIFDIDFAKKILSGDAEATDVLIKNFSYGVELANNKKYFPENDMFYISNNLNSDSVNNRSVVKFNLREKDLT